MSRPRTHLTRAGAGAAGSGASWLPDWPAMWPDHEPWISPSQRSCRSDRATGPDPERVSTSDIDVLLTTEGTYPYVTGGVSTWAHQLVTGLAEKQFVVYSVVANTIHGRPVRTAPQPGPHDPGPAVGNRGQRRVQPPTGLDRPAAPSTRAALRTGVPPRLRPAGHLRGPRRGRPRRSGGGPVRPVDLRRPLQPEAGHARRSHVATVPRHVGRTPALPAS